MQKVKCGKIKSYAITWLWGSYIIRVRKIKVLIKLLHPIGSYIIEKEKQEKLSETLQPVNRYIIGNTRKLHKRKNVSKTDIFEWRKRFYISNDINMIR